MQGENSSGGGPGGVCEGRRPRVTANPCGREAVSIGELIRALLIQLEQRAAIVPGLAKDAAIGELDRTELEVGGDGHLRLASDRPGQA